MPPEGCGSPELLSGIEFRNVRDDSVHLRVMVATLASVAVHAGLGWTLAETRVGVVSQVSGNQADTSLVIPLAPAALPVPKPSVPPEPVRTPPEVAERPPVPPETKPPEVSPGIDNSDAKTDAWIGFSTATKQQARKSETEQSAVSPSPGVPLDFQAPAPPPQAPEAATPPAPAEAEVTQPDPAEKRAPSGGGGPVSPTTPAPPSSEAPKAIDAPNPDRAVPQVSTQTDGPRGDAEPAKGIKDGSTDAKPRDEAEPAAKTVKEGQAEAPEAPGATALPAARQDSKDEQGKQESKAGATGEVAEKPQEKATGEKVKDEMGLMREAKPEQRLAQAALAMAPQPLGVDEAMVGPPVPAWLRELAETRVAAATSPPKPQAATLQKPGPDAKSPAPSAASPKPLPAAGMPAAGEAPGEKSDSEANAASVVTAETLRTGKVLARQGLKIRTVRPRFSLTTLLTSAPRDATMDIVFGRDGSVIRASFETGETTGSEAIDSVLVSSAYRWEAAGKELERLPAGISDAGVTIKIKFVLR